MNMTDPFMNSQFSVVYARIFDVGLYNTTQS